MDERTPADRKRTETETEEVVNPSKGGETHEEGFLVCVVRSLLAAILIHTAAFAQSLGIAASNPGSLYHSSASAIAKMARGPFLKNRPLDPSQGLGTP